MRYHLIDSNLSNQDDLHSRNILQDTISVSRETGHHVSMETSQQTREKINDIEAAGDALIRVTEKISSVDEKNDEEIIGGFFSKEKTMKRPQTLTVSSIVQVIRDDIYQGLGERITGIEFCHVPAGTFRMGGIGHFHRVRISRDFYLGKYPVTQSQWQAVMENNPSHFKGADLPVETVSWDDCQQFIERLNHETGKNAYRLPTEAEWEYACRGGSITVYSFGDDKRRLAEYGWYNTNSGGRPHPVGQKTANPWGLHDMHGNVWEWCQDWYAAYPPKPMTNPEGPSSGSDRVLRGGGWFDGARRCRSGFRSYFSPDFRNSFFGFRLVRMA
jgi:hypothetical protein